MVTGASKYVIFQTKEGERAVIFPAHFYHDAIADCFADQEPISAGFVSLDKEGGIRCFGESLGLDLKARRKDDRIVIQHQLTRRD